MGRKRGIQYRDGGFYRQDDRTGFTVRAWDTQIQWNDLIVAEKFWEPRQPQDLVTGVPDNQNVPNPRPLGSYVWDGPLYFQLTQAASIGATFLYLGYIAGIGAGDNIGVMLDNGQLFNTKVSGNPVSNGINITNPLPGTAASGNVVIDYESAGP